MRAIMASLALAAALTGAPRLAAEDDEEQGVELADDWLHAPLPLYTFAWPDLWPRHFVPDPEPGVISLGGCESRVAFGDWRFVSNPADPFSNEYWLRVDNYGVFHCAANLYNADAREELSEGEFSRGFFALIGEGHARGRTYELWVLQEGFVPGSSYMLLARNKAEQQETSIRRFEVLQRRCPRGKLRVAEEMDVWRTRYCAIDSRAELLTLARRMLQEPFLGALTWAGEEKGPEAEASDPLISE